MTNIASRTPEGEPNLCPVCGKYVQIEPSSPAGDAPCPHCGSMLWFVATDAGVRFFDKVSLRGYRLVQSPVTPAPRDKEHQEEARRSQSRFRPGERLRIIDGTFEGFEAEFIAMNPKTGDAMLSIEIFGRKTPVELPVNSLEPN